MVEIIPSSPTQNDIVILKVTGQGCVAQHELIDSNPVFTGDVAISVVCFTLPPQYTFSFSLGKLQPGSYTARHLVRVIELDNGPTISTSLETTTFKVTASQAKSIPTLDTASILLLTMVLALTVGRFMRKKSI